MNEVFKTCIEDDRYEVSNLGRIRNKETLQILKPINNGNGYLKIGFWTDYSTVKKQFYIHRIVANNFIPNPKNKKEVNHKDGDKTNNKMDNLEWVTNSENKLHRYRVLKQSTEPQRENCINLLKKGILKSRKIKCLENNKIYNSLAEASKDLNINIATIYHNINNENRCNINRKCFYHFIDV